jgi:hypothetical protein
MLATAYSRPLLVTPWTVSRLVCGCSKHSSKHARHAVTSDTHQLMPSQHVRAMRAHGGGRRPTSTRPTSTRPTTRPTARGTRPTTQSATTLSTPNTADESKRKREEFGSCTGRGKQRHEAEGNRDKSSERHVVREIVTHVMGRSERARAGAQEADKMCSAPSCTAPASTAPIHQPLTSAPIYEGEAVVKRRGYEGEAVVRRRTPLALQYSTLYSNNLFHCKPGRHCPLELVLLLELVLPLDLVLPCLDKPLPTLFSPSTIPLPPPRQSDVSCVCLTGDLEQKEHKDK